MLNMGLENFCQLFSLRDRMEKMRDEIREKVLLANILFLWVIQFSTRQYNIITKVHFRKFDETIH